MTLVVNLTASFICMARDACDITQCEPIGSAEHCHPERDNSHVIWEQSHMNSSQVKTCAVSTNPSRHGEQLPYISKDLELHGEPLLHVVMVPSLQLNTLVMSLPGGTGLGGWAHTLGDMGCRGTATLCCTSD